MQLDVYSREGKPTGEKVTLAEGIFGITPNDHAIYEAVTAHLANQRQGTHKTKTYGEVAGSGKKLWKQKHTGRARIGAVRSPLWKGGGTIFGPQPRDYGTRISKRTRQLARKSALSYKAKGSAITVVEDFTMDAPKTKDFAAMLKSLSLSGRKTLCLVPNVDATLWKSGRNIARVKVVEASKASTYDILDSQVLVFQKSAIKVLEQTFEKQTS